VNAPIVPLPNVLSFLTRPAQTIGPLKTSSVTHVNDPCRFRKSISGCGSQMPDKIVISINPYEPAMPASPIASNYTRNEQWAPLAMYGKRAPLRRKLRGQHTLTRKAPKTTRKAPPLDSNQLTTCEGRLTKTWRLDSLWWCVAVSKTE